MTPAQKQAAATAEKRLQAMLAMGLKVEALEKDKDADGAEADKKPKRVVYGKKKKGPVSKQNQRDTPSPVNSINTQEAVPEITSTSPEEKEVISIIIIMICIFLT